LLLVLKMKGVGVLLIVSKAEMSKRKKAAV
jgi:hypothetical protein